MDTVVNDLNTVLIYVCFALSLNLIQGYAGLVSVAHAAFGAVGGYTIGYLFLHGGHALIWPGLALGVAFAAFAGFLVGLPALRLKTEWLLLLTLAVQTIVLLAVVNFKQLGASYGLQNVSPFFLTPGKELDLPQDMLPLFLGAAILIFLLCFRMGESPYGRVLNGIREDEIACRSLGKNVFAYKLQVFSITAGMAGLAGALLVINNGLSSPQLFDFQQSTAMVAMVIVGGAGNLWGTLLGVVLLTILQPILQTTFKLSSSQAADAQLIAFGVALVIVLMVRPGGILPDRTTRTARKNMRQLESLKAGSLSAALPSADKLRHDVSYAAPDRPESARAIVQSNGAVAAAGREVVLKVTGLSKRFGGIVAADSLDIELRAGHITALVGPNGAGKTTVFNLLTGAIAPDAGTVLLRGEEIVGMTPDAITRRGMARSFQNVRIFARLSVLDNVMLGIQKQPGERLGPLFLNPGGVHRFETAARKRAMDWLGFVGMTEYKDLPAGALAFGQQKLVALARVLATEADVVLLDEPASGIDHQWVDVMLSLIDDIRKEGRTVCIVEHNLHVVDRLADHTYFMELGKITAQGNFAELTSDKRLAEAYFGTA